MNADERRFSAKFFTIRRVWRAQRYGVPALAGRHVKAPTNTRPAEAWYLFSATGATPYQPGASPQDFAPTVIRAESPHHWPRRLWNGLSALLAVSTKVLARWARLVWGRAVGAESLHSAFRITLNRYEAGYRFKDVFDLKPTIKDSALSPTFLFYRTFNDEGGYR